ncbi:MAG: glycosyltransferase, partial [Bacteroidales bacterium]|nr:glycosyltransferase [Bacteroidales bacterium]
QEFDIGIMPLPDDEWSRGKCGFKGLQYMALGIPAVLSPVGVNTEIVQDGVNGFLAANDEEWIEKLSLLIESPDLRKKIGLNGRKTIVEKYSFNAWKEKYISYFEELVN